MSLIHIYKGGEIMNDLNNDDFFTDVVNEYSYTIYRVALNITKNSADAFDVCQEVFIRYKIYSVV